MGRGSVGEGWTERSSHGVERRADEAPEGGQNQRQ